MLSLKQLADNRRADSLAARLRRQRFSLFAELLATAPRPLTILDVGGTQEYWQQVGFADESIHITLLNLRAAPATLPGFDSVAGDACDLSRFGDRSFDIVFSNSVIEHLGTAERQAQMAAEVQRVGRRYVVQTPNRLFPLEPHFLFPFFQFLPLSLRVFLVTHRQMGWHRRYSDRAEALRVVSSIRLITEKEMRCLFPCAKLYKERLLGLVKSFVAYGGWE